jgi:serine protease Do
MNRRKSIKTVLIALLIAGAVGGFGYDWTKFTRAGEAQAASAAGTAITPLIPAGFSDLVEKVRDGVVNIQVIKLVSGRGVRPLPESPFGGRNPFEDFFGPFMERGRPERRQQGIGSGFIMNREGYILTNNHVVEGADQILVKLANGKQVDGRIIGLDPKTDLALVKIDGEADLKPLRLGDSDALKVGSWVVAAGSPFGLELTITAGIISAKGRVLGSGPYDDFIQTDASINPGNSGGPLVNLEGEVIGINTAIIASGQGIGFAIPINMAREVALQLQEKGHVTRGQLGVTIQDITPELAKSFGLKDTRGALIAQVVPGSPAEEGGIRQGDVIVEFDGKPVADSQGLPRVVATTAVGKTVVVKVLREGKEVNLRVKVGEMEEKAKTAAVPPQQSLGLTVQSLTPQQARELGMQPNEGVLVTQVEPGSAAAESRLRVGDVIREVNRQPVRNAPDFAQKVAQA